MENIQNWTDEDEDESTAAGGREHWNEKQCRLNLVSNGGYDAVLKVTT